MRTTWSLVRPTASASWAYLRLNSRSVVGVGTKPYCSFALARKSATVASGRSGTGGFTSVTILAISGGSSGPAYFGGCTAM